MPAGNLCCKMGRRRAVEPILTPSLSPCLREKPNLIRNQVLVRRGASVAPALSLIGWKSQRSCDDKAETVAQKEILH